MLANMQAWRNDAKVLSVSLSQFEVEYDMAIRCIAVFLGLSGSAFKHFSRNAAKLDVKRMKHVPAHVTRGRYSNDQNLALQRALVDGGAFGSQFDATSSLYEELLDRSSQLYGCPRAPRSLQT